GIFAAYLGNDKSTVSVNLSLNYIKPIPSDDSILITAKVTSAGRRIITISAECRLKSNGLLTNTAIGTYAIV
ncbi:MAG TPA: PaaI family thioesterase, partial [Bacillota bacterium]|nr:PaaI family thioesterase [Bacillota bacterium]